MGVLAAIPAHAQRSTTQGALSRLEETLALREEEGMFARNELKPMLVVSVMPAFEETRTWYPNAALASLAHAFGASSLRSCEACMAPRVYADERHLEQNIGALTVADIVRIDDAGRGTAPPARTAIWLDRKSVV